MTQMNFARLGTGSGVATSRLLVLFPLRQPQLWSKVSKQDPHSGASPSPGSTSERSSSGSLANFAAMRRASSRVSSLAAERRPGSSSK